MLVFPSYEQTSIFYNGVGLSHDLMVLLHELGHCFHYFLGKDVTPYSLQEWSAEVAEAGSMSMEYIGLEHAHLFLSKEQSQRLKMKKLKSTINLLIATARGDEFQHWIYQNPQHTRQQRHEKWNELGREYHIGLDCTGYEDKIGKTGWQFSHILQMPFYFIDYSISEILALSIWDQYKKNPSEGILLYKRGCALAASKSVHDIYKAFGTSFSFGEDVLEPLAQRMRVELSLI
jgi:oligoendopeptidase F